MRLRCFGLIVGIFEDNYTENHVDKEIVELVSVYCVGGKLD